MFLSQLDRGRVCRGCVAGTNRVRAHGGHRVGCPHRFAGRDFRQGPFEVRVQVGGAGRIAGGLIVLDGPLVRGRIDLMLDCGVSIWDNAALAPIIEGAGGRICNFDGNREFDSGTIMAGSQGVVEETIALFESRKG